MQFSYRVASSKSAPFVIRVPTFETISRLSTVMISGLKIVCFVLSFRLSDSRIKRITARVNSIAKVNAIYPKPKITLYAFCNLASSVY